MLRQRKEEERKERTKRLYVSKSLSSEAEKCKASNDETAAAERGDRVMLRTTTTTTTTTTAATSNALGTRKKPT